MRESISQCFFLPLRVPYPMWQSIRRGFADPDDSEETTFTPSPPRPPLNCSATSRLLIQSKIYDQVVGKILDRAASISVGNPLRGEDEGHAGTCMGPLVSGPQRDKVLGFISRVRRPGRHFYRRTRCCFSRLCLLMLRSLASVARSTSQPFMSVTLASVVLSVGVRRKGLDC